LETALAKLQKLAASVLKSVSTESQYLEDQLQADQMAAERSKKQRDASQQDAAAIAASHANVWQELALTQQAFAQLLKAIAVEVASDPNA
jgi:hypothetical protein